MVTKRMRVVGALSGVLAAGAGVGAAEIVARFAGASSPVVAVGNSAIDYAPPFLKDFAVETFGTADKLVLIGGVIVTLAVIAAFAGAIGVTRKLPALVMAGSLGAVALLAALSGRATATTVVGRVLPSVVAIVVSVAALALLLSAFHRRRTPAASPDTGAAGASAARTAPAAPGSAPDADRFDPHDESPIDFDRRRFLASAVAVGAVGIVGGAGTRLLPARDVTDDIMIPAADDGLPAPSVGTDFDIDGLSPYLTPNEDFYRVDTALTIPQVDASTWRLRIHGLVDNELDLSFEDLLSRRLVERDITLTCVSNGVGGQYVGNARWIGVPIAELLEEAGLQSGADAVLSTAVDGFTIGTPLEALTDGRDSILAVSMNGEPLPPVNGFPVRMVVPGLYGYVSATKWLVDIEVSRFADFEAYWTPRGWDEQAPIKMSSRIDVPKGFARVPAGPVVVAGVAWAQHTGITAAEVSIDGADWAPAELAAEDTIDTWRQWRFEWDATDVAPGSHQIRVRATDATGEVQTEEQAPPRPNGASGWHNVVVTVV
jgi:DMSO/TMAO reductase YedYZ molybdopterin-dependent catalytic subunit